MLSAAQQAELDQLSRTHPQAGMRLKALAIRAVARGHTRQQVGAILHVSAYTSECSAVCFDPALRKCSRLRGRRHHQHERLPPKASRHRPTSGLLPAQEADSGR